MWRRYHPPIPSPHPTRGSGERRKLPSGIRGEAPGKCWFLGYFLRQKHDVYAAILRNLSRFLNQKSAIAMTRPSTDGYIYSGCRYRLLVLNGDQRIAWCRRRTATYPGHDTPRREPTTAATVHRARRLPSSQCRAVRRPSRRHRSVGVLALRDANRRRVGHAPHRLPVGTMWQSI